ncbi:MAG: hypothetical protein KBC78_00505 [Candidatus Pacebacteria bacterium]|nr:hypothetical protein [Candidatus Paceibacterota bacterium]
MINEKIRPFYIGRKNIKKFKGKAVEMTPFLYTNDDFNQIGIGIHNSSGNGLIWGLHSPITIIRWWRSLKVLEKLHIIENNTLALCWYVTAEKIDKKSFSELALQTGGNEAFSLILNTILNSAPPQADLNRMITNLRSKGFEVNYHELQKEINRGMIEPNPVINSVISKALRHKLEYEKAKIPLPKKYRLNLFFTSLGIESIWDKDGNLSDVYYLDLNVKRHCIGNKKIQNYLLFADENNNTKPTYLSFTGTTYVFDSVKFCKGRFYLKTKIKIPNQEETVGEYTLADLREKIGPITLANFPKIRKILSTFITCFR